MPSSEYTVNILIKSKDQTSKPATKVKKSIVNLKNALKVAAAAMVVLKVAQKSIEFVKFGAKVDRAATALDNLAKESGTTGKAIIKSIQAASGFTIDRMTAMTAANKAMLLGVADSPEEFARLTKQAVLLGRAMGQDAASSIDDFVTAAGRQSKMIADNLGLMVGVEDANKRYAESLGVTVGELDDTARKQAFLTEMLRQAELKTGSLENTQVDAATQIEILTASWKGLTQQLGESTAESLAETGALDKASEAIRLQTEMLDLLDQASKRAGGTRVAMGRGVQASVAKAIITTRTWQKDEDELRATLEETNIVIKDVTKATRDGAEANWDYGDSTDDAESGVLDLGRSLGKGSVAYLEIARAAEIAARETAAANREFLMTASADFTSFIKLQENDAKDLAEDKEAIEQEHADKVAAIRETGRTELLAAEQARYDEEKLLLDESRIEQEIAQKESLGRMVLASFTAWADINKVASDEIFKTQLFIQEKYGLITEEGAEMALALTKDFELIKEVGIDAFKQIKAEQDKIARHIALTFSVREVGRAAAEEEHGAALPEFGGAPTFAHGGTAPGGTVMVGELGPERVRLPAGSHVTSNAETRNTIGSNNTYNINDGQAAAALMARERMERQAAFARGAGM